MMRILVANIPGVQSAGPEGEFVRTVLSPLMRRNFELGTPADTEYVMRWSEDGFRHPAFGTCRYLTRLAAGSIAPALENAEREGFDGCIIACFADPALEQCRANLNLPVVGLGQAALLMAAAIGSRIGIVTPSELFVDPTKARMASYGLSGALVDVIANPTAAAEHEQGLLDSRETIEVFHVLARRLIAQGADVIVPGCALQAATLRLAPGAEDLYPNGVTHVDEVPVVDVLASASSLLLAATGLRRVGSAWRPRSSARVNIAAATDPVFWNS